MDIIKQAPINSCFTRVQPIRQTTTGLGIVWKPAHSVFLMVFFLYLLKYRNPVAQKPQKVSGVLESPDDGFTRVQPHETDDDGSGHRMETSS